MNLSRKTLLLLTAVSVLSVVVSFFVLRSTVFATFLELENDWAANNTATVEAAIQTQLRGLLAVTSEYSQWDDTFRYLQEGDRDYVNTNITEHELNNLDLDAIVLLKKQGSLDVSIMRGPDGTAVYPPTLPFEELDSFIETLLAANNDMRGYAGILATRHGPLLLASKSVTRSDGSGPFVGSILFMRFLNESRISEMEDSLNISFDAVPVNSARLAPELLHKLAENDSEPAERFSIQEPSRLLSYKNIRGILGPPAFVLEVATPRGMSAAGLGAVNLALLFLALTSLLYLLVSNFSLKRMIVRPISNLTERVGQLQESGDLSERLHSERNDELGTLTRQIDNFVVKLDTTQSEITEARDTALKASKAKSEFLATMSHEIRTPINGVLGMTELLLVSNGLSKQQRSYAETVQQSGASLLSIVNDILDISKIEAGKLELNIEPFNLKHLVEECLELLAESAHSKGLELHGDISVGTHAHVQGDPARLRQILINLIGNALKFTRHGEIIVRVMECDDPAGPLGYRIEIKDTGVGIDPDYIKTIFDPFTQQDGSTTRRFGGTGLGLSICKQLVALMSGEIGVNSRPGGGSTFWFTVPLGKNEAWSHRQHSPLLTDSNGAIQPRSGDTRQKPAAIARECDALRILVVEDNKLNQAVLEGMLHALGHTTWVAGTGCEALAAFQSQEFDVVLMDCLMPVMDGFEATCNIRKWEEQHNRAPTLIVAVTANARQEDRERCLAMGMDDFLSKPYTIKQLTQALKQNTSTQSAPTGVLEAQNSVTPGENEKPELKAFEAPSMFAVDNDTSRFITSISKPYVDQSSKTAADLPGMPDSGDHTVLQSVAHKLKSNAG